MNRDVALVCSDPDNEYNGSHGGCLEIISSTKETKQLFYTVPSSGKRLQGPQHSDAAFRLVPDQ